MATAIAPKPFPVSTAMQEMLAALQAKLSQALMSADYEEQAKRRSYDESLQAAALGRVHDMRENTANLVDRGLNRSGIALQSETDLNRLYDTKNAASSQVLNSSLAELARKRLDAQSNYNLEKAGLQRQTAGGMMRLA